MGEEWIDISVPLRPGMPQWPGDDPFRIDRLCERDDGGESTLSTLTMSAHAGTHVDAPRHYLADGATIDTLPVSVMVGEARVIAIRDPVAVTRDELLDYDVQPGSRLLFKTRNSECFGEDDDFDENYVYVTLDAARYLAECKVRGLVPLKTRISLLYGSIPRRFFDLALDMFLADRYREHYVAVVGKAGYHFHIPSRGFKVNKAGVENDDSPSPDHAFVLHQRGSVHDDGIVRRRGDRRENLLIRHNNRAISRSPSDLGTVRG